MPIDLAKLQKILGVDFINLSLLEEALIHRSYLNEIKKKTTSSNERLEFLGDAVLELLVSKFLYLTYPNHDEGKLTYFRSAIVNTKSLAIISAKLNLGDFMKLSKGEETSGGRTNETLLANIFEAVLGAIFIDQGIEVVEKYLKFHFYPLFPNILTSGVYIDYKSLLQEKSQEIYKITPVYRVVKEEGPDHAKTFYCAVLLGVKKIAQGQGKSKQEAEQDAAKIALSEIKKKGNNLQD